MRRTAILIGLWLLAGPAAAETTNRCEIAVTGDATASIKAEATAASARGKLAAVVDYWLSDSELRTALGVLVGFDSKASAADKQRKLDEAMKKDPRFMLVVINCLTDDGGLVLSASGPSRYADFPMKPGTHPIVPTTAPRAGDVTAMFHLTTAGKRDSYTVAEPGKLVLTQFDRKGIAGSFTFKAQGRGKTPRHIEVAGKFSYACSGGACAR